MNDKREGQGGRSTRRAWSRLGTPRTDTGAPVTETPEANGPGPSTAAPADPAPGSKGREARPVPGAAAARLTSGTASGTAATAAGGPVTTDRAERSDRSAPATGGAAKTAERPTPRPAERAGDRVDTADRAATSPAPRPGGRPERSDSAGPPKASLIFNRLQENVEKVLRGKHEPIRLAIACLLAEGHLLIEDKPGTGKTSLARALAASIGGTARRIQFTPDLLPADITGVTIYDPSGAEFRYRPGPVFCNIVVADEINRASPKTQAALLEVMEERQVTADGVSRPVPRPFMVVATQNPLDFHGTYPLPEVQLDRFAMKISLGYTDKAAELEVMAGRVGTDPVASLEPVIGDAALNALIEAVRKVTVSEALREYVSEVVMHTRAHRDLRLGVSTRGTLTMLAVARAYAVSEGRAYVTPDDVKAIVRPALAHRMAVTPEAELDGVTEIDVLEAILAEVPVPRSRPT